MRITYRRAAKEDIQTLIQVRNLSFYEDYVRWGFCPGYGSTPEELAQSVEHFLVWLILADEKPVGHISVMEQENGTCYLCCLCVIPACEGRGIGSAAFRFVEGELPQARRWELETPRDKGRNVRFYQRLGFQVFDETVDHGVDIVKMEKIS